MSTPAMPPQVERIRKTAAAAAGVGLLALVVGGFADPRQFFHSYLLGFLFWAGASIGCLSILCIHHLTGGAWGIAIRRLLEAGTRNLYYIWVFFLPLAVLGLPYVYPWADPHASDPKLHHALVGEGKAAYLNVPFFLGRAAFYFAVWFVLARVLNAWSLQQDQGDGERLSRRMRGVAGGGLVLMGLTITFASVDWAMSLDPTWYSTIYGVLFMVGQVLSAFSIMLILVAAMGDEEPLSAVVSPGSVHDLGKLFFAFIMLWAYVSLSQFLIIWSGNIPEEIPWYLNRTRGGWQALALFLVFFHFTVPFVILLSRDVKRNRKMVGRLAVLLLLARMVDLYWLVGPELRPAHAFGIHWMDLAALAGMGGLWFFGWAWQAGGRPLLATGDPELRELAAQASAHAI